MKQMVFCFLLCLSIHLKNDLFVVNFDEPPVIADPWNINIPGDLNCVLRIEEGVIQVYKTKEDLKNSKR